MSGMPAGAGSLLGKRLGKYEILALLALGGTAEIYLARIDGTNGFEKYVVVKCLHDHLADDQEFVKMFLDEARMAAVLDHSNVVQTFELGEHENRYYMVMEFLAGLSLAMVVRRAAERVQGGRLPVPLILNIAAQAAAGLHYAHERQQGGKPLNMVHRDISPQNLVVGFEGVVKVVDFGIARAEYRETKTKAGTIKGKFAYMSPEQCVATNVDRRTDVFALGVIVHELLTGRRLFKRNSPYETYQAVIDCQVPRPSSVNVEIDPAIDDILMKAVTKEREDRYPSAEAFGDAMLGYLHHRGKGSGPGEIGRWFDEHFQQEIEEHGDRMRELIQGRDPSIDIEEPDAKKLETVPFVKKKDDEEEIEELSLMSSDVEMVGRESEASLDQLVERLGTENEGQDDDGGPAPEKTRIEQNPLELLQNHLDSEKRESAASLPAPPPKSGKFPDLAQIPTVIAQEDPPSEKRTRTPPGGIKSAAAYKATVVHEVQQPPPMKSGPLGGPEMAPTAAARPIDPNRVARIGAASSTHDSVELTPAQQAELDATGLSRRGIAAEGQRGVDEGIKRPSAALLDGYPVAAGGRPFNTDLAPADMSPHVPRTVTANHQQAANLMSPVGDRYPQVNMDWAAAAAAPAKALTRVQLAMLFVGALVAALLVTMVIAKIIH